MLIKIFLIFVILINFISLTLQIELGEPCIVERTKSSGICKTLLDCPKAIENYQRNKQNTHCSFAGEVEIVCCPEKPAPLNTVPVDTNRISYKKCMEYKNAIYKYEESLSPNVDSDVTLIKVDKCGHGMIPLVVGGENAHPREFPHMALIGYGGPNHTVFWGCGGTLISDQFVLTAAHCIKNSIYGDVKYVRLGELDILSSVDDASPEDFEISTIIIHSNYTNTSKYNDIALVKLIEKVYMDPYKRPACLAAFFDVPTKRAIATGWGNLEYKGKSSNILQKVVLDIFTYDSCAEKYNDDPVLNSGIKSETQLCAGSKTESKDTCQGDSGGPLQIYHPTEYCMYSIVGVTSFGFECGRIGIPGVYTRVFQYLDWIEENVWPGE